MRDDAAQWERYADDEYGVFIGLHKSKLLDRKRKWILGKNISYEIDYTRSNIEKYINSLRDNIIDKGIFEELWKEK